MLCGATQAKLLTTSHMGPIGMPEIVVIVIVLLLLTLPVVIAIALAWFLSSRRKHPQSPQMPKGVPERLAELDDLRSRNLITEAEYVDKRSRILGEI